MSIIDKKLKPISILFFQKAKKDSVEMLINFNVEASMRAQRSANILSSDIKTYFVEKYKIPFNMIITNIEVTDMSNLEFSITIEKKGTYKML